jgi:hypothetical protein
MNSRRSFFKRLAAVVAAVAIAPEIAFRRRLELPGVDTHKLETHEPIQAYRYVSYKQSKDGIWQKEFFNEEDAPKHANDNCVVFASLSAIDWLDATLQQSPAPKSIYSLSSAPRS